MGLNQMSEAASIKYVLFVLSSLAFKQVRYRSLMIVGLVYFQEVYALDADAAHGRAARHACCCQLVSVACLHTVSYTITQYCTCIIRCWGGIITANTQIGVGIAKSFTPEGNVTTAPQLD